MARGAFIAGDWGTSRLRLYLCGDDHSILDSRSAPGALATPGRHERVLDEETSAWTGASDKLPFVLCGMVGSSIGWVETPYLDCPADPASLASAAVSLRAGRVHVIPGLRCRNRHGAPDVMRGEETQVLGALQLRPALCAGRHLLCLPGTHTKWVLLSDGGIAEFLTAPVGELFDIVSRHSLFAAGEKGVVSDGAGFAAGVAEVRRMPEASLVHRLFECRSRRVSGELAPTDVGGFLSGLLIGSDVSGVLALFCAEPVDDPVTLIGAPQLLRRYSSALAAFGRATATIDGDAASLAGLAEIHRRLPSRDAFRAAG